MNEKKIVSIPSTFDTVTRRRDRSVSMKFTSNLELSSSELMKLDEMTLSSGWLVFSQNELQEEELPEADAPGELKKSKMSRLRGATFVYWQQHTDMSEDFDSYWNKSFEQILQRIKDKLE